MDRTYFHFQSVLKARADIRLKNITMEDLWKGFCFQSGAIDISAGESCCLTAGSAELPVIPEGAEYAIAVTGEGIAVRGRDYSSLARGFMALMMRIEPEDPDGEPGYFRIECCELAGNYRIAKRMIHFCVFPETTRLFLRKCIRLAGIMQYTHVVLEFWGMLRYDCMEELSWPNAYSKEEAAGVIREIEDMGMKAVPMFNHLGHAAGCRVSGGKHVVLDRNPRLAPLFAPDGWSWNITSRKTSELLEKVREELYGLFGDPEYFHLGCDEVYSYEKGEEDQRLMREFLTDLIKKIHAEGKKPIIWGDMLLNREMLSLGDEYFCSCDTPEHARQLLEALPEYTVIADWHYDIAAAPVKTELFFKSRGFEVFGVPWLTDANLKAHIETVSGNALSGIMVSTWHTLAQEIPHVVSAAVMCGAHHSPWSGMTGHKIETETAALLRKVCFVEGNYREAGWTDSQVFLQARPMV